MKKESSMQKKIESINAPKQESKENTEFSDKYMPKIKNIFGDVEPEDVFYDDIDDKLFIGITYNGIPVHVVITPSKNIWHANIVNIKGYIEATDDYKIGNADIRKELDDLIRNDVQVEQNNISLINLHMDTNSRIVSDGSGESGSLLAEFKTPGDAQRCWYALADAFDHGELSELDNSVVQSFVCQNYLAILMNKGVDSVNDYILTICEE